MNKGIWYGASAYALWGLFPVYFKWLQDVPALQVIGHRIVWSFLFLIAIILLTQQWRAFRASVSRTRVIWRYGAASVLIGINWLIFVWSVSAGHIVDVSLGYFITPLLSVFLGMVFLRERLRAWQWLPVALATAGVVYLTLAHGSLPWIGLSVALSFGFYGLVKKTAPLGSLFGLTLETGILLLPALLYLLWQDSLGQGRFLHEDGLMDVLLIGAGVLTAIPLLLFASATQRVPLTVIGLLQYIAPTLQCLLGVLLYNESFTHVQLISFSIVWVALAIFAVEGLLARRATPVTIEP